ncbi:hypothetical protein AJ79_03022 [Helicocarpus griseus UAMH5409]|uniref:F-box domain-containing protein n=1 Tax=Helicocarpus griseus UAMH5409 TaxID=1447875 RepID=A0A2B7Y033_9EURO|nr:hypothetical protein AJ79_03022 [Helicocarpus griseus UAMH5409]
MHPEPSQASHPATYQVQSPPCAPNPTQHGLQLHDESLSGYISREHSTDGRTNAVPPDAPGDVISPTPPDSTISRKLSRTRSAKSVSPVDRIDSHENAWTPSSRKAEEFGFKVVPSRGGGITGQILEEFPNEVLTHILSHLPPSSLSSMSLVSRRFHGLVTTPHAWRIAFSRFFPGPASLREDTETEEYEHILAQRRTFSRLTALASWRNEYILRTRLLRSLSRGKPAEFNPPSQHGSRQQSAQSANAVFTYSSMCIYPITHIDGTFGSLSNNKPPLFIHGAAEQGVASMSDPTSGKTGTGAWGSSFPQMFKHFADIFPGEAQWGLGPGNMVGMPNVMDVSQPYGMVYGEACPQGRAYYLSSSEKHGRFLSGTDTTAQPHLGIPSVSAIGTAICSVWIAKSPQILEMTNGLCGILCGSSLGTLTAYALGPNPSYDQRFERGQVTAKWVLCPGVPIIAISADGNFSSKRRTQQRAWAVVLNALGELFYLTDVPYQPEPKLKTSPEELEQLAWATGRTVRWDLVEPARRVARPDPFNRLLADGSYSPRSSSDSMGLNADQIFAETKEIEKFLAFKPKHFRKVCDGWNMRRKLEVDFAGDDHHNAGESFVVINCGFGEDQTASIRRFMRQKVHAPIIQPPEEAYPSIQAPISQSIFGGPSVPSSASSSTPPSRNSEPLAETSSPVTVEWRMSNFVFDEQKPPQITTSAIDTSTLAQLTTSEDPLFGMCGGSSTSSQSSPLSQVTQLSSSVEIPGHRARYMAVGTLTGSVYVWNMRAAVSQTPDTINRISPLRVIRTDSPQISCVALTSLYVVHGGNDGLVQAWDPLASSTQPIRTLNSRFSSRARRRLVQAETSALGVGHNFFAAGAICLDPDPTVLRGIVSLGSHLRYWSYSSSAADQYKSSKRRLRHSHRGHNTSPGTQRFMNSGRGTLQDYIANEKYEMERQKQEDQKERQFLSGRFGVDLLGPDASEEELLAYAQMLSEKSYTSDERKRRGSESSAGGSSSSETIAPSESSKIAPSPFAASSSPTLDTVDEELDPDIAEAIRLSLLDESSRRPDIPFRLKEAAGISSNSISSTAVNAESSVTQEIDDLEFALQLSLAEEESRKGGNGNGSAGEEYPALGDGAGASASPSPSKGRGKGKARAW